MAGFAILTGHHRRWLLVSLLLAVAPVGRADDSQGGSAADQAGDNLAATAPLHHEGGDEYEVPPPPFSEGIFPCSECHDNEELKPNPTRRKLEDEHDNIVLRHDEKNRWCLDCHDAANRDKLHLASGQLVDFSESYRLCGQCHGDKYRDWKAGVHGKRSGSWNGHKKYRLCAHCHDPHQPRFKPLKPKPPPRPPAPVAH